MRTNLPIAIRSLRIRHRWRQQDLAERAGLSRDRVSRLENDDLEGLTVRSLRRITEALGADLVCEVRWRGAELDRLIDRDHAHIQNSAAGRLTARGWDVLAEITFNHFGDRGSCDLIAWHAPSRTLLIVEVKSRLGNLQELLHRLDVKVRLGPVIARQVGWQRPQAIWRALVLPEGRSARRIVARHQALFAGFGIRGRAANAWLRSPAVSGRNPEGLIWYEQPASSDESRAKRVERIRSPAHAG